MVLEPSKTILRAAGAAALLLALAACGEKPTGSGEQSPMNPSNVPSTASYPEGQPVKAKFTEFEDATAITYHQPEVPKGANVETLVQGKGSGTMVSLKVEGLEPNREYGAHVHVNACGQEPDSAGPHYQNKKDPVQPSVDPAYANPKNEVWLDFKTDGDGNGQAQSTVDWKFRDDQGKSIVIHAMKTMTGKGKAGTAGERLACINIR